MSVSSQSTTTECDIKLINTEVLVVIDPNVELPLFLSAGVQPGATKLFLDSKRDGVEQITEALTARSYTSIHIVSHGSPGCLYLGNSQLSLNNLKQYTELLRSWGRRESPRKKTSKERDIPVPFSVYLYGCNIAAGKTGTEFIELLHQLTGASVAASAHRIGSINLGGDWHLEVAADLVEPRLAFLEATLINYPSVFAAGDLDNSFGNNGKVITNLGNKMKVGLSVAVANMDLQQDGKIVVSGERESFVYRYNRDGSLDRSFIYKGHVTESHMIISFGRNSSARISKITLQPDNKILAVGRVDDDFALVRYNRDGILDRSFGAGGKVTTNFGDSSSLSLPWDVALQSNGKIVVVGHTVLGNQFNMVAARYQGNGSLDTGFGIDGKVITDFGVSSQARSIALQPDNKIVVAGYVANKRRGYSTLLRYNNNDFNLLRYNSNGSLDTSFGNDGKVTTEFLNINDNYRLALQPDGKILVVGVSHFSPFTLLRYNSNGSLDSSFGNEGKVTTDFGKAFPYSVALQSDGKIVVVGQLITMDGYIAILARFNSNGSLDSSFGNEGKVTTDFGDRSSASSVTLQSDGKILIAGFTEGGLILARYEGDPPEVTLKSHQVNLDQDDTYKNFFTIYEDTTRSALFYYLPEEFRLTRYDVAPYHPFLKVAFQTLPSQPENSPDSHQVEFTFKTVPYFSQKRRKAALNYIEQNNLVPTGTTPSLALINPESAHFFLTLPKEEGGFKVVERQEAYVVFNQGITDTLMLSPKAFAEVFHSMRVGGETLNGHVKVRVPDLDDEEQEILFSGRLDKMVGSITEQFLINQSSDDRVTYNVHIANTIESSVTIREVSFELFDLDQSQWVPATVASDTLPLTLQSGEDKEIIVHSTQIISRASRARLGYINAKVDLDFEALWLSVQETPGWQDLTHDVTVQVDERYFSGSNAIDRVIVTFNDEEATVTLTRDESSQTVNLIKPFLLYLLRDEEANDYVYKVDSYRNQQLVGTGELSKGDAPQLDIVPPLEV